MAPSVGSPAMISCEPRQARKGATAVATSCAGSGRAEGATSVCSSMGHPWPRTREPEGGAASAALGGVCSSNGVSAHPWAILGTGFESLKVVPRVFAHPWAILGPGFESLTVAPRQRRWRVVCSSVDHHDRGFERLKGCAASVALGFGGLFRGFTAPLFLGVFWLVAADEVQVSAE